MPEHSEPKIIDRSSFPAKIRMPDIAGYTSEVFKTKTNVNWKEAEAGSYAWFDSYGIFTGRKRQEFFDTGFGLMAALILAASAKAKNLVSTRFLRMMGDTAVEPVQRY